MKVLLASFYTPGIRAMEYFFQEGLHPRNLRLLTHAVERNQMLLAFAAANGVEVDTCPVRTEGVWQRIVGFSPDVIVSLYFRDIIPKALLDLAPLGAINLHPALLPRHRGTFSVPWAIIDGDEETGFTYHHMGEQVDAGNIVLQRRVAIRPEDTAFSLYHRLIAEAMTAFGDAFRLVTRDHYAGEPQRGTPSYHRREVPFGGHVDPSWGRERVGRFIRAMHFPPFPGAMVRLTDGEERIVDSLTEYDALVTAGKLALP